MLKIGVFDSGLGGLTVVKSIIEVIKGAKLFYIADTKNAPYGEKTSQDILKFSLDITNYFVKNHDIDVLIVACNTATSVAITTLRENYPNLIVIGTEPGLKPAFLNTNTNAIGVLATPATLKGTKYVQLSNKLLNSKDIKLYEQACYGLVDQIEKGEIDSLKTYNMLNNWLLPMKKEGVDTIVLGCTHYPLVKDVIFKIMNNDNLLIIETGEAISKHILTQCLNNGHKNKGKLKIYVYSTSSINTTLVKNLIKKIDTIDIINII